MATVFLDTSPFIYLIEEHPEYLAIVEPMFRRIEEGKDRAVTSVVTLAEVLVKPLRLGRVDLAEQYQEMLQASSGVDVRPVSREVSVQAAELRARWNLSLPDAIQAAIAVQENADLFVCNDTRFRRVTELRQVVLISEVVPGSAPAGTTEGV